MTLQERLRQQPIANKGAEVDRLMREAAGHIGALEAAADNVNTERDMAEARLMEVEAQLERAEAVVGAATKVRDSWRRRPDRKVHGTLIAELTAVLDAYRNVSGTPK